MNMQTLTSHHYFNPVLSEKHARAPSPNRSHPYAYENDNNVEATFDFVERIVRHVAFDNVASTLLLV